MENIKEKLEKMNQVFKSRTDEYSDASYFVEELLESMAKNVE